MKNILIILLLCFLSMKTIAKTNDSTAFHKGKIIVSMGYGFPILSLSDVSRRICFHHFKDVFSDDNNSGIGTFYLKSEYGLSCKVGIGVIFDYDNMQYEQIKNLPNETLFFKRTTTSLACLFRFNYHFCTTKKIDTYFGIGTGFRNTAIVFASNNPYSLPPDNITFFKLALEGIVGIRYYFTPNIGIYSEIGFAKSIAQIGISAGF